MRLSMGSGSFFRERYGEKGAIEFLAKAGFDAIDYVFSSWIETGAPCPWNEADYKEHAKEILAAAKDNGICFNQAHAPIMFDAALMPDLNKQVLPLTIRSMEVCGLLEIPQIVVHPIFPVPYAGNRDYLWDYNQEFYRTLQPYAKEFGVKIALENLYGHAAGNPRANARVLCSDPYEYADFYDALGDEQNFVCCVDTGHAGLAGGDAAEMIRVLGKRVKLLHIHDNDFFTDIHVPPYQGKIEWDSVLRALADVGYDGDFTFELSVRALLKKYDPEFCSTVMRFLHDLGRNMIGQIEKYRKAD